MEVISVTFLALSTGNQRLRQQGNHLWLGQDYARLRFSINYGMEYLFTHDIEEGVLDGYKNQ